MKNIYKGLSYNLQSLDQIKTRKQWYDFGFSFHRCPATIKIDLLTFHDLQKSGIHTSVTTT